MRGKLIFGAGVGIGYLLGTRAGRERFDQISGQAKKFWSNNTVQEAAGAVQERAGRLYDEGKKMVTEQAHKMREMREHRGEKQDKQRHDKEFRRREGMERHRQDSDWGAPVGYPASSASPSARNPY